jgi:sortase A
MSSSDLDDSPARQGRRARAARTPAAPHPPLGPVRRGVREVGLALITAGTILLLFVLYQLVGTNFAEEHNQSVLAKSFLQAEQSLGSETTPTTAPATSPPTTAAPGAPVAGAIDHLVIPKIGVDKYVVEGVDEADLQQGPGHYPGTPLPGELGNAAIAGHRTTYGAPFFRLNELAIGDPIKITNTARHTYTYLVDRMEVVSPNDVSVLDNTPDVAELTLTTCNPRFSATSRLIVVARLTGTKPLPAPVSTGTGTGALGSGPASLTLGSGNSQAWPAVALFGALVLAGWILVRLLINRTRRWSRLGAYVGGIAVCLVPLWFLFENVVRLLPQNI